jgi:Holliday junction resolvasome RuvABC endonuclease subunit
MDVLGIDPGFASMGWAVLSFGEDGPLCRSAGLIKTKRDPNHSKHDDNLFRIQKIAQSLERLDELFAPAFIASEAMSWTRHANADRAVAMAWGAIGTAFLQLPVIQISPVDVKDRLCGMKTASKALVEERVRDRVSGAGEWLDRVAKTQRNHVADAMAVALACSEHTSFRLAKRMLRDES